MRFSLKWLFALIFVVALIAASLRLITVEERKSSDVYAEYMGLSPPAVEQFLVELLQKEGFAEVAGWDPALSAIPTEPPSSSDTQQLVFVPVDRYFEKQINSGKIGCALGVELDHPNNQGGCQCRTRSYFAGRVGYWRWTPPDDRVDLAQKIAHLNVLIAIGQLASEIETKGALSAEGE